MNEEREIFLEGEFGPPLVRADGPPMNGAANTFKENRLSFSSRMGILWEVVVRGFV